MPITTKATLFGSSVDLPFRRPDPFNPLLLADFSNRVADALLLPIQSEQFRLRIGDALYWYELLGSFLNDNIQVRKSADRVTLTFKNGRVANDVEFIATRVSRFLDAFASGFEQQVVLTAFCHAGCNSTDERDHFLAPFAVAESVVGPGITGRVRVPGWPEPIKVNIEASFVVVGGLFVGWETAYTNREKNAGQASKISEQIFPSFETAAGVFGVKVEFQ
jgi:hypothetical protein